ncbi:hypothetical protein [Streptomyces exfoliatus]|uniref:hypothetical protein n=1 Tax=Streptomyces TaxID=1883 RepID=UPI0004C6C1A3|nr:hypothetical protein [Streptomyces exfoliatus]
MRGRGTWWAAVAGATAAALLAAGCGPGAKPGAFGRQAAHAEITAAVEGAGLPESDLPGTGGPTPTGSTPEPTPTTERERVAARMAACSTGWQYVGPLVEGSRGDFDKAVAALVGEKWVQDQRQVEKLDDKGSTMVAVTLKKRGWTLFGRHHSAPQTLSLEMISLQASEDSCMKQFTDKELDLLEGEGGEQP